MNSQPAALFRKFGDYEIVRLLATGGMAEVYEARRVGPRGFTKKVALKRILPQLAMDVRLVQMFCEEARVHAALSHPNLVELVDFGENGGELYIVMEFVDGLSCADLLSAVEARRRTVELGPALHIAREVLSALEYAHTVSDANGAPLRLVHRDVAPNNILIGKSGRVLLADFGIVRSAVSDVRTAPGEIRGKIGYVSPEQALGRPVDARSDLFSLGVVLAELLIGRPLFFGDSEMEVLSAVHAADLRRLNELGAHIPRSVQAILRRALAHDPARRYLTARHFAEDVEAAIREFGTPQSSYALAEWLADLGLISLKSGLQPLSTPPPADELLEPSISFVPPPPRPSRDTLPTLVEPHEADEASYRVRRPGQTIVGPLTLARMLEMIATARAGADTEVSRSGGPFMPLGSCFELSRLASRSEYRFSDPFAMLATERHRVERGSLPGHLFRWIAQKRTGLVCARSPRAQERVFLVMGVPGQSASTNPEELLGANLVAGGLLSPERLDRALEDGYRAGQPLGRALIGAGLLQPNALLRSIALQRAQRLASLLRFDDGELYLIEGAQASGEALALPVSPQQCLANAVRTAYAESELRELLGDLPARPLGRSPDFARIRTALALEGEEAQALDWAARGVAVSVISREAGARGSEAQGAALRGVFLGLVSGALAAD